MQINRRSSHDGRPSHLVVPLRWALTVLIVCAVFVLAGFGGTLRLFDEVNENRLAGCRLNNSTNHEFLKAFNDAYDVLIDRGADRESIEGLRATLPKPAEIDRDCNADGVLDEQDYAPPPSPLPPRVS